MAIDPLREDDRAEGERSPERRRSRICALLRSERDWGERVEQQICRRLDELLHQLRDKRLLLLVPATVAAANYLSSLW